MSTTTGEIHKQTNKKKNISLNIGYLERKISAIHIIINENGR